jgi:hypothetical protein
VATFFLKVIIIAFGDNFYKDGGSRTVPSVMEYDKQKCEHNFNMKSLLA